MESYEDEQGCDSSDIFWGVVMSGLMTYTEANECDLVTLLRASERLSMKSDIEAWQEEKMYSSLNSEARKNYKRQYRRVY